MSSALAFTLDREVILELMRLFLFYLCGVSIEKQKMSKKKSWQKGNYEN